MVWHKKLYILICISTCKQFNLQDSTVSPVYTFSCSLKTLYCISLDTRLQLFLITQCEVLIINSACINPLILTELKLIKWRKKELNTEKLWIIDGSKRLCNF